MVEWSVAVMLESDMAHAFLTHSNKDMTATDTQKNTVRSIDADPASWMFGSRSIASLNNLPLLCPARLGLPALLIADPSTTRRDADKHASDAVCNGCWQVYYVAKQCSNRCSPEEYAIALAKHFVDTYPKVGPSCPPHATPPLPCTRSANITRSS